MYIPFESLPDHARIWIYQSDRKLSSSEINIISDALRAFTEQWSVHGTPMNTSFDIRFGQFIILAADDRTSGCSIDSSVRTVKSLGQSIDTDFFNRNLVAFHKNEDITLVPLKELGTACQQGVWNQDTPVFNNLVSTKGELQSGWVIPAGTSWLRRYLPYESVTH